MTVRWSGGEPGRGNKERSELEIGCGNHHGKLIPPRVSFDTRHDTEKQGVVESGSCSVWDIEPRFIEPILAQQARLERGEESFFEIKIDGRGGVGEQVPVRRFRLNGAPAMNQSRTAWRMDLQEQEPSKPFGGG